MMVKLLPMHVLLPSLGVPLHDANKYYAIGFCCHVNLDNFSCASTSRALLIFTASLGEQHVGYNRMDFPTLQISIVGGRPFSCGGEKLFRPKLLGKRYGVNDMDGSAKKIYEAALGTPEGHSVVLLAHNGPTGLGSRMNDICGRDWVYGGGDHGDPDLTEAMLNLKASTQFPIPLVVFGHMHKDLAYGGQRKMIVVGNDGTIYLNGAIVPRVKHESGQGTAESEDGTLRAFTLVEVLCGKVEKISETWVAVHGSRITVAEERVLFESQ